MGTGGVIGKSREETQELGAKPIKWQLCEGPAQVIIFLFMKRSFLVLEGLEGILFRHMVG